MAGRGAERSVREVRLQAGDALGSDDGVVGRPGKELEPVAFDHVDGALAQPEPDAAPADDDDLVVRMVVRCVSITRAVRPRAGNEAFLDEARPEGVRVGHGRGMVPGDGRRHCRDPSPGVPCSPSPSAPG